MQIATVFPANIVLSLVFSILPLHAEEANPASVVEVKEADLGFDLPLSILNQKKLNELEAPEYKEGIKQITKGADLGDLFSVYYHTTVYRATDGTIFCCDDINMTLWIRRKDSWECLINGIRVDKTFGGAPAHLPFRYLGKGFFEFSQTLPVREKKNHGDKFPMARAATYLLDSKSGEIQTRTDGFRYDQNPPVKIPPEWYTRIGVSPLPEN